MATFASIVFIAVLIIVATQQFGKEKRGEKQRLETVSRRYAEPSTRDRILEKRIWQGMTRDQLIDSWGQPLGRSNRVLKTKVKETFTYGSRRYGSKVYLENGIVVGWHQPG